MFYRNSTVVKIKFFENKHLQRKVEFMALHARGRSIPL
jgi:hypothetical protein